ncbi:MAG TPA: hypothetical protein VN653_17085, partial [Anaerolineales bacterium]|nr:hypothetical protein [Anaerolineales bacterium]
MHSTLVKRLLFGLLALILFGCAPQRQGSIQSQVDEPDMPKLAALPDLGPAPELTNDIWLNV